MEVVGLAPIAEVGAVVPMREAARARLRRVLVRRRRTLHGYIALRVGGDRDAADDLLQQTCCEAARHRRVPEGDEACAAWLHGIARNLIRKHWRSKRKRFISLEEGELSRRLVEAMESGPLPAETLIANETMTRLTGAIAMLPNADQRIIFAFYYEGRAQTDLATEWGVSVKSIEARLYRARKRLREVLHGG